MALATSLLCESLARCARIQASRSATTGALSSWRAALRFSGLCPLIARSISNSTSIRRTASSANGEITAGFLHWALRRAFSARSAITKNGRRAWTQHAASRIGPGQAAGLVKLAVAAVGIGLEDAGIAGQMRLGMLAGPIARVIEHGRRRRWPAEWPVVAHIDPDAAGVGLAFGEDRDRGVVSMQSLSIQDVSLEALDPRHIGRSWTWTVSRRSSVSL
jgi:hypothetical protein